MVLAITDSVSAACPPSTTLPTPSSTAACTPGLTPFAGFAGVIVIGVLLGCKALALSDTHPGEMGIKCAKNSDSAQRVPGTFVHKV